MIPIHQKEGTREVAEEWVQEDVEIEVTFVYT